MEEAHPQTERRSQARFAVDTDVSLVAVSHGGARTGRMFELSVDGCRVRADRCCPVGMPAGIEVMFKLNGIGFRLAGTLEWVDACQTAGIRFSPMAPRRREALEELLAELEAEEQIRAAAETESSSAPVSAESAPAEKPTSGPSAVLSMPARESIEPRPIGTPGASPSPPGRATGPPIPIAGSSSESAGGKGPVQPARTPPRERRVETRHAVDTGAIVFLIDVRARILGRIVDLSMSGCRIRTDEPFPVGIYRRVETEFNVDGLSFRLAGVVQALHNRFTVGIRFLDMSVRKRDQLQQLMEEIDELKSAGVCQAPGSGQ